MSMASQEAFAWPMAWGWNVRPGLIEEQQQIGALGAKAVDSAWRAENLRADVTYPQSGSFSRPLEYTYDGLDRLQTVRDTGAAQPIADYDYIGAGRVLQRSYPQNGTRETMLVHPGSASE